MFWTSGLRRSDVMQILHKPSCIFANQKMKSVTPVHTFWGTRVGV